MMYGHSAERNADTWWLLLAAGPKEETSGQPLALRDSHVL